MEKNKTHSSLSFRKSTRECRDGQAPAGVAGRGEYQHSRLIIIDKYKYCATTNVAIMVAAVYHITYTMSCAYYGLDEIVYFGYRKCISEMDTKL